jgi:hypothetical protein
MEGDSIAAWDRTGRRLSIFDARGTFVRSLVVSLPGGVEPAVRLEDGAYLLIAAGVRIGAEGPERVERVPFPVYVLGPASSAERLLTVPGIEVAVIPQPSTGSFARTPRNFGRMTLAAGAGTHWYLGNNDRAEIHAMNPAAELNRIVRWPHSPRRVTGSDVEREVAAMISPRTDSVGRERVRALLTHELMSAETMPAFTFPMLVDADANLWVREYAPNADRSAHRFLVFDPEGIWLGTVSMPTGLRLLAVARDRLVGVSETELGEEVVSVHRIERSPRAPDD